MIQSSWSCLSGMLQAGYSEKLGISERAAASSALASTFVQQTGVQAAQPAAAAAPAAADIFLPTRPSHGRTAASNVTVGVLAQQQAPGYRVPLAGRLQVAMPLCCSNCRGG